MRSLTLLCVLLISNTALAADLEVPTVPDLSPGIILQKSADRWIECKTNSDCSGPWRGIWWPLLTAQQLTEEHLELKELRPKSESQKLILGIFGDRLQLAQDRKELAEREAMKMSELLKQQQELTTKYQTKADKAERELRAWYRSPIFWFSAGILTAAVFVGGAAAVLN